MYQQMSLFDDCVKIGDHIKDMSVVGDEIPFSSLKDYVGKVVVYKSFDDYRLIKVIKFFPNEDPVFRKTDDYESPTGLTYDEYENHYIVTVCMPKDIREHYHIERYSDRIAYCTKPKVTSDNLCYVSEHYCTNGKYPPIVPEVHASTFYEFKGGNI